MVNPLVVRKIVGIIGNVISFGLFLSPLPTFIKIIKRKDVEDFSPMPYICTLLNCAIWIFYGLPVVSKDNTLVYTINGVGFLVELIYLIIFFIYSKRDNRLKVAKFLALEAAFMAVVIGVVVGAFHVMKTRTLIVGVLAVIFGTIMYASPLTVMKTVITTKSVEYMPFTLSFVGFINGICWTTYSLLLFDVFVLIPNGAGTLLGLAQLILYFWFYRSTPRDNKTKAAHQKELQMSAPTVRPDIV